MKTFCNICSRSLKLAVMSALCILFLTNTAFADEQPDQEVGPGVIKVEAPPETKADTMTSLGMFTTTGYCSCKKCSKGFSLTYSGTVPKAKHTISADLSVLPLGTKVQIGDIIYTVEDIGGSVNGHKIDIYYDTHDEALAHGLSQSEVFLISWPHKDSPAKEAVPAAESEAKPEAKPKSKPEAKSEGQLVVLIGPGEAVGP